MSYDPDDTITAIATAPGGAARGMVRVSGPATQEIVANCFSNKGVRNLFSAVGRATAVSGQLLVQLDDATTRPVPCELFLWPTCRSYTRQPLAEFHTFGSPPLLEAVVETACRAGARLAEPGEFTLRAFLAGRLDLTQAEAVLGVIDAQAPEELQTAVAQLAGNLARPLHRLRDELLSLLAELEAGLDFGEEDIRFISAEESAARLHAAGAELRGLAEQMASRHSAHTYGQVVLSGPPNTGKSSLFNALAERFGTAQPAASAIVSDQRGTTRDYLTTLIDLAGIRCQLIDTAGIEHDRTSVCEISAAAQVLSSERRRQALVRIVCVDAINADALQELRSLCDETDLAVLTKIDLTPIAVGQVTDQPSQFPLLATSSVTGQGLDELANLLIARLTSAATATRSQCVAATADRCRDSLRLADAAVTRAAEVAAADSGDELVAVEVRVALAELGKVVGAVYTDDLLDRIFKSFCIGK